MKLTDFEQYINDTILERGLDYYRSGCVISLDYDGEEWVADVEGSYNYTVTVNLSDDKEIIDTDCDCPYDMGIYCKHQAAVFYALRNEMGSTTMALDEPKKKKNLDDVIRKLDKKTLIHIVLDMAGRYRNLKDELLLLYDEKPDARQSARTVIRNAINSAKHRGFVDYEDTAKAVSGADIALKMVYDKIAAGDIETAVSLCVVILEEMMDMLDFCDDSSGYVGDTIGETIENINEAIEEIQPGANEVRIFDIVYDHAMSKVYNNWTDWRIDLVSTTIPLCGNAINRDKIERYISMRQKVGGDGWSREYELRQLQILQYRILEKYEGKVNAEAYLELNMDNPDFRRIAISTAMVEKAYDRVEHLCLDGESNDSAFAGLVREWRELRYQAYEKSNNAQAQKELAMTLLLSGDFEYFMKLKALYSKSEWKPVLEGILAKMESGSRGGIYVKILVHEKLKARLLEYCRRYISSITTYYTNLLPEYRTDVGEIFTEYIFESAKRADNRKRYRDVCNTIKQYKNACGDVVAKALAKELALRYARRPAFVDELKRV